MCLLVRDSTAARLPVMVINVLVGEGGGVWFGTDRHASLLLLLLSCVGIGGMVCVELNRGLHAFKATTAVV